MSSRADDEQNNNQQSCQDKKTDRTADQTDHRGTELFTHRGTSRLLVAALARITCMTTDTPKSSFYDVRGCLVVYLARERQYLAFAEVCLGPRLFLIEQIACLQSVSEVH